MSETWLDEEGRLPLPPEVRERLGWQPGQAVYLSVEAGRLVATAAGDNHPASWRERARQLAEQMRQLSAAQALQEFVTTLTQKPEPPAGERRRAAASLARGEPFNGVRPHVPASCYVHPTATLIGDVVLGEDCSIWPGAVLRGDVNHIRVGARTNIQEGAVLHVDPGEGHQLEIGSGVTIGHQATVHACRVADHVLIGIHAVVLDGAEIGEHSIIGAGAVVTPGTQIPPRSLVLGVPGRVVREVTPDEIQSILWHADSYVGLKNRYLNPEPAPEPPIAEPAPAALPAPAPGTRPRVHCARATGPVTIDGALDEPTWAAAGPLAHLQLANGRGEPRLATEVRACWDDEYLYIAFSCKDTDVWATFAQRDDPLWQEEVVEVFLCPTGDLRHYFEIELSPANVLFDAKVFNPELDRRTMLVDTDWNAPGIRTAVRVSGTLDNRDDVDVGWIAELAIPFRDLGLDGPPPPGTRWRANFYRIERGEVEEYSAWSPTMKEPADFHVPQCFGELVFVNEEEGV